MEKTIPSNHPKMHGLRRCINQMIHLLEHYGEAFVLLLIRIYVALWVFWPSGWSKFTNYLNDDWGSTLFLFEEIHPVPVLPPEVAAVMGTAGEIGLSALLVAGLFGRFAALGLLGVTAVIELSFQINDANYVTDQGHVMWALLLAVVLVRGSGALSLDRILKNLGIEV